MELEIKNTTYNNKRVCNKNGVGGFFLEINKRDGVVDYPRL